MTVIRNGLCLLCLASGCWWSVRILRKYPNKSRSCNRHFYHLSSLPGHSVLCATSSHFSIAWLYCKGAIYPHHTEKGIEGEVFIWLESKTLCDSYLHLFDTAKKAVDTGVQDPGEHSVGFACFIQPRCLRVRPRGPQRPKWHPASPLDLSDYSKNLSVKRPTVDPAFATEISIHLCQTLNMNGYGGAFHDRQKWKQPKGTAPEMQIKCSTPLQWNICLWKRSSDTRCMNESWGHYAKWEKQVREEQVLYDLVCEEVQEWRKS